MPPQHDTLTPASSESISAFLALDEDGRNTLLGNLSPGAKQSLLMGLRTLSQAHEYGTTQASGRPGQREREPIIERGRGGGKGIFSEIAQQGVPEAAKTLGPAGKVVGAAALTAAQPEAGLLASTGLAALGGAGGEAGEQLLERGMGSEGAPQSSGEAAKRIVKSGAEMGAFELGTQAIGKGVPYLYRAYLRHADPFNQGIDTLFRGFAPPSSMPELRENLIEASDDLVNVFNRIDKRMASPEIKGGIINPDKRFRIFRNELNSYMEGMYHSERAGQIAAGVQRGSRVTVTGNPNELEYIGRWLSKQLPIDSPALRAAQSLAAAPLRPIPIADADALAVAVNSMDMKTAWEGATSRTLSGKRALDQGLKKGLDSELHRIGQPGVSDYERRYAALAQLRELAEKRMTPAEQHLWMQRLHSFFSLHGINVRTHLGAFESPGSMLEEGLQALRKAGRGGPSRSVARPGQILQGEIVPEGEALTPPPRGYPQAGPPVSGAGGGTGRQPPMIRGPQPKGMLPPPKYEGAERRSATRPFTGIQGPDPTRIALMRDVQNKINGLPKGDPAREYLQSLLDDMKAHPFERADEGVDINKVRAAQEKRPSGKPGGMKPPPKKEDFDF